MQEILYVLVAFAIAGQLLITQKSYATAFKWSRRSAIAIIAAFVVSTIVGWLGLRFLYFGAYWWAAWTMAMVAHMGIFNTAILTSYYLILQYLGIPELLVYMVIWYIWIFFGVFAQSVMPFFLVIIFTSIPFTVAGTIYLAWKWREQGKLGEASEEGKLWRTRLGKRRFSGGGLGFIQFIAIMLLLATNIWAQLYLGITYWVWGYFDLLVTIFLPLALVVCLPILIVWGIIWGATKLLGT